MTADFQRPSRVNRVAIGLALASLGVHSPREAFCFMRSRSLEIESDINDQNMT